MTFPTNGTPTSNQAADAVNIKHANELREEIFSAIESAGDHGATDEELQATFDINGNTQRPRRWELSHRDKRIVKSDQTRKTKSGRNAAVWVINPAHQS